MIRIVLFLEHHLYGPAMLSLMMLHHLDDVTHIDDATYIDDVTHIDDVKHIDDVIVTHVDGVTHLRITKTIQCQD